MAWATSRSPGRSSRCGPGRGKSEELAKKIASDRAWPEATAIIEVGQRTGLLVPARARDRLRPIDPWVFTWIAARRVAQTADRDGLMDYRLNGALFDVFAMAAALIPEPSGQAGVVSLMAESPGPFEDLLELGPALAAAAVAWGAHASPELRYFLTERALSWIQPMGADWNREVGTALLVLECQRHEEREQLSNAAVEIVSEIVQTALSDVALAESPPILATLDTALAMLVAGHAERVAAEGALGSSSELDLLLEQLPIAYRHRVGLALARILPPGPRGDQALLPLARQVAGLGDSRALGLLARVSLDRPPVAAWVAQFMGQASMDDARSPELASLVEVLCAHPESCPAALPGLARLIMSASPPELRIGAGQALSRAGLSLEELRSLGVSVDALEALFLREDLAADETAGVAGALLALGGRHPRLLPAALALIASELPEKLTARLAEACDLGLARVPEHVGELLEFHRAFGAQPGATKALLRIAEAVSLSAQRARDLGPFDHSPPHASATLESLAAVLLEVAADPSEPILSAEAAVVCTSLMQGDEALVRALATIRGGATDPRACALYDLALGASRALIPEVIELLGRDAAMADPEVAAAACVSLRLGVETFVQASGLDRWLPQIRGRVEESGPHDVPALQLVAHLATLPLGLDPR